MSKSLLNALKATAVLVAVAAVCVALLTVCNMFFPKYVPTLDSATAKLINNICPTGQSDGDAFSDGYIVLLKESELGVDIAKFNKNNKTKKAEVLAVYAEPKGDNMLAYIIESKSAGRDGDVVILTAYSYREKTVIGATAKKQGESYWDKLPENLFEALKNTPVDKVDLTDEFGKTGATLSLTAIERAVNISNKFAIDYRDKIIESITGGGRV